jgi:predicted RNA-binding Zn-ribbon protein involved in translation (DUF1610 family)
MVRHYMEGMAGKCSVVGSNPTTHLLSFLIKKGGIEMANHILVEKCPDCLGTGERKLNRYKGDRETEKCFTCDGIGFVGMFKNPNNGCLIYMSFKTEQLKGIKTFNPNTNQKEYF